MALAVLPVALVLLLDLTPKNSLDPPVEHIPMNRLRSFSATGDQDTTLRNTVETLSRTESYQEAPVFSKLYFALSLK